VLEWVQPALAGIGVGSVAFVLLLLPLVLVQKRSFGRIHLSRLAVVAALCVYGATLVAYTVVPDADTAQLCETRRGGKLQPIPLDSLAWILRTWHTSGLRAALTTFNTFQLAMNVLLFVPLGIFLRSFFHQSIPATVGIGFLVSLLIEATQYTGFWWIYSCGIRVADVDDLITNTAGTLVGALIGPLVRGSWLPHAHDLKETLRERVGLEDHRDGR
jgi:glycopeptide antibiotics resistance protein